MKLKENKNIIKRESNYELLRIIAIFMVITLHYLNESMGGILKEVAHKSFNYYIAYFIESYSIIAVNLFVIIMGYFQINKNKSNIYKIIKLIVLAYLYGTLFYFFAIILGEETFNLKELIIQVNPFLAWGYWFIKTYVVLYLISPYLNKLLKSIKKSEYKILILILTIFFNIWPSFFPQAVNSDGGYGIISFVYLYIIGGYLKLYYENKKSFKGNLCLYCCSSFIVFIFSIIHWGTGWSYNFLFNIISTIYLFLAFSKLNIKSNAINKISTYTFAVYIIHFNKYFIEFIYKGILKCQNFYQSKYFIFHLILSVIIIFLLSVLIEIIRKQISHVVFKYIKVDTYIESKLKKFNFKVD